MNKTTTFLNLEINDYIRELLIYQVQLKNQGKNYSAESNILLIENINFQVIAVLFLLCFTIITLKVLFLDIRLIFAFHSNKKDTYLANFVTFSSKSSVKNNFNRFAVFSIFLGLIQKNLY